MVEMNISEGVYNNVIGTYNVAKAENRKKRFKYDSSAQIKLLDHKYNGRL